MVKISDVEYIVYCHATENCSKVIDAVKKTLPLGIRERVEFVERQLRGYYGNPIKIYSVKIIDKLDELINYLSSKLRDIDKAILSTTLDLRYDSKSSKLYLRIDKQEAYRGNIAIQDSDDIIKIIISFRNRAELDSIREYLRYKGLIR